MTDSSDPLRQSRDWVERFVVALDVCPFARREVERDSIRYVCADASSFEQVLLSLLDECRRLDDEPSLETTLLILVQGVEDFEDYLDLLALGETLLEQQGYEGIYQLASFHPDYCFEAADADDPANYTNRSPWPMLHILREASVENALSRFAHPERIPSRNIKLLRDMGRDALAARLNSLRSSPK